MWNEPAAEGSKKQNTEIEDFNNPIQALWKQVVLQENLTFENYIAIDNKLEAEGDFQNLT